MAHYAFKTYLSFTFVCVCVCVCRDKNIDLPKNPNLDI